MGQAQRIFIAIALPETISLRLGMLQDRLKAAGVKLRWVPPSNIHLTLKFIGDMLPDEIGKVSGPLRDGCRGHATMDLAVQGLGVFPGIRKPRVLWSGIGGDTQALSSLQQSIEAVLADLGLPREMRAFKAHLTLGRFKWPVGPQKLVNAIETEGHFDPLPFKARQVTLYKSQLQPGGAVYTPLDRFDLVGGQAADGHDG